MDVSFHGEKLSMSKETAYIYILDMHCDKSDKTSI